MAHQVSLLNIPSPAPEEKIVEQNQIIKNRQGGLDNRVIVKGRRNAHE